jgi:hypothetical protein
VAGWDSLRVDLRRLRDEAPGALVMWPSPETERRHEKQFRIDLAAWATDIAGRLHATYGGLVDLRVGAMSFPDRQMSVSEHALELHGEPAESAGLVVEVLSPLTIRSGHYAKHDVLVTNRAAHRQVLLTAGDLYSAVTDSSGNVVGRYVGAHNLPRIEFPIEPQRSRAVPALIGTASLVPDPGYAVPPGRWSLVVSLTIASGHYLSAPLELTVTP